MGRSSNPHIYSLKNLPQKFRCGGLTKPRKDIEKKTRKV